MFPGREGLTICFAQAAYQIKAIFDALNTGIHNFEVRDRADLNLRIGEADVVLASGMWHNGAKVIAILLENLDRRWRGEAVLRNPIV